MAEYIASKEPRARLDDGQEIPYDRLAALMPASRPSPEGGRLLRAARFRVQLSTRDVERLSRRIADDKKSRDYYISHAWLTDAENGAYTPSIFKFWSLSIIYKRRYEEILAYFGIQLADIVQEQKRLSLPRTHLIGVQPEDVVPLLRIPEKMKEEVDLGKTNLVSRMFGEWGGVPVSLLGSGDHDVYGYVGTEDFTLYPLIRPGSFVQIDASQTKVDQGGWLGEIDRPIYFVELRESYACSWCETREGRLLLIPCPRSSNQVREVRFPGDAEIVGRVTAVSMRIAD